ALLPVDAVSVAHEQIAAVVRLDRRIQSVRFHVPLPRITRRSGTFTVSRNWYTGGAPRLSLQLHPRRERVAGAQPVLVAVREPALPLLTGAVREALGVHEAGQLLDVVVADRVRVVHGIRQLCIRIRLEIALPVLISEIDGIAQPGTRIAVGLQLGAHTVARGAGAVVGVPVHDPGDVLDVVAPLMAHDVELCELARRRTELLL